MSIGENIWTAASDGDAERVAFLIESGVNTPNDKDENEYTPLHAAVSYNHGDLVRMLVTKYGADVNIRDADGDTPLLVVETVEMMELLLSLGADPNVRNNEDQGLIEKAIEDENEGLLNDLVTRLADPAQREALQQRMAAMVQTETEWAEGEGAIMEEENEDAME